MNYFFGSLKMGDNYNNDDYMKFGKDKPDSVKESFQENNWKSVKNFILSNNDKTFNK